MQEAGEQNKDKNRALMYQHFSTIFVLSTSPLDVADAVPAPSNQQ
jgi:hypothetical protein